MASFGENKKELKARREDRRGYFILVYSAIFFLSYFVVGLFLDNTHTALLQLPNMKDINFYLFSFSLLIIARFWWRGLPHRFIPKVILKHIPEFIIHGEKKELDDFFFQEVVMSDELPRSKDFKYLESKKYNIKNMFDFDVNTFSLKGNGTNEIILLFRDEKKEKLKRMLSSRNEEKRDIAKHKLRVLEERKNIPSESQIKKYTDLMQIFCGLLEGYENDYDSVKIKDIKSPLVLEIDNETKRIIGFYVDESRDVFKNGEISLSINMIIDTVNRLSILFNLYMSNMFERKSRISKRFEKSSVDIPRFINYFKLVVFRWLLSNYGSLPSGWFVVRIEDYTLRAIISTFDNGLIPAISSQNDGTNDTFSSDVEASQFLYLYYDFKNNKEYEPIFTSLEWCFNTTKEINEVKARENAKSGAEILEKEETL